MRFTTPAGDAGDSTPLLTLAAVGGLLIPGMLMVVACSGRPMDAGSTGGKQESLAPLSDLIQEDLSGKSAPSRSNGQGETKRAGSPLRRAQSRLPRFRPSPWPATRSTPVPACWKKILPRSEALLLLLSPSAAASSKSGGLAEHPAKSGGPLILFVERLVFPTRHAGVFT